MWGMLFVYQQASLRLCFEVCFCGFLVICCVRFCVVWSGLLVCGLIVHFGVIQTHLMMTSKQLHKQPHHFFNVNFLQLNTLYRLIKTIYNQYTIKLYNYLSSKQKPKHKYTFVVSKQIFYLKSFNSYPTTTAVSLLMNESKISIYYPRWLVIFVNKTQINT